MKIIKQDENKFWILEKKRKKEGKRVRNSGYNEQADTNYGKPQGCKRQSIHGEPEGKRRRRKQSTW